MGHGVLDCFSYVHSVLYISTSETGLYLIAVANNNNNCSLISRFGIKIIFLYVNGICMQI